MRPVWNGVSALAVDVDTATIISGLEAASAVISADAESVQELSHDVERFVNMQENGLLKYGDEVVLSKADYSDILRGQDVYGGVLRSSNGDVGFIFIDLGKWAEVDDLNGRTMILFGFSPSEYNNSITDSWIPLFMEVFFKSASCNRIVCAYSSEISPYFDGLRMTGNSTVDLSVFLGICSIVRKEDLPENHLEVCEKLSIKDKKAGGASFVRLYKYRDFGSAIYLCIADNLGAVHEDFRNACHALGQKCLWDIPLYLHNKRIPSTKRVLKELGIE